MKIEKYYYIALLLKWSLRPAFLFSLPALPFFFRNSAFFENYLNYICFSLLQARKKDKGTKTL